MTGYHSCGRPQHRSSRRGLCAATVTAHTIDPSAIIASAGDASGALSVLPVFQDVRSSCDSHASLSNAKGRLSDGSPTFHTHWPVPPFVLPAAVCHLEYASCAAGTNVADPRRDKPDAPARDHALEHFGHDRQPDVASPGPEVFPTQLPSEWLCPVPHRLKAVSEGRFLSPKTSDAWLDRSEAHRILSASGSTSAR